MTRAKKGKSFVYTGGLDSIEVHATNHTYVFNNGESVEVCPEDVEDINHPDISAGSAPAPADPTPQETEEA
ncbi:MAG: hypothetical protein CME21_00140 [Gemmatimonadetes bacterium]|nr:hypothetical protein [Gemmatimonadota bacterium]